MGETEEDTLVDGDEWKKEKEEKQKGGMKEEKWERERVSGINVPRKSDSEKRKKHLRSDVMEKVKKKEKR